MSNVRILVPALLALLFASGARADEAPPLTGASFMELDAMLPSLRGRPNAPYLLPGTVRTVADVTGRSLEDVCGALAATSEAVYGTW